MQSTIEKREIHVRELSNKEKYLSFGVKRLKKKEKEREQTLSFLNLPVNSLMMLQTA